jgi:hypothetical protein
MLFQVDVHLGDLGSAVLDAPVLVEPIMYADYTTTVLGAVPVTHPSLNVKLLSNSWLYPSRTQVRACVCALGGARDSAAAQCALHELLGMWVGMGQWHHSRFFSTFLWCIVRFVRCPCGIVRCVRVRMALCDAFVVRVATAC